MIWRLMAGVALCLLATVGSAQALTVQRVGNFEQPIYVTSAPANPDRLFVVEREGTIVVFENGEVKPFADIRPAVNCCVSERGLQSIALSPDFAQSGRLFLFYTGEEDPGELHVAEMVASGATAPTSSLRDVIPPIAHSNGNHNGGQLQFGPDGALYASTGDGGGGADPLNDAQNPSSFLGKILRIVPSPAGTTIPDVWSLGLRNPFRFSFDRQTGDLWIGDVGEKTWEEVDFAAAPGIGQDANFGWDCFEAKEPGPATDPECASPPSGGYVEPVFEYDHSGSRCAIIGGYVARDPGLGEAFGRYLYGDNCGGDIRSFLPGAPGVPAATDRYEGVHIQYLDSFGEDSCGRLYAISGAGPLYRLLGSGTTTCATATTTTTALAPSHVGVRAATRKVKRNRRSLISAWVSPCNGRRSGQVTLWRGRRNLGTRRLDQVCSARFRPRIGRRSSFRVTVKADQTFAGAISRRLTIRPVRRHKR
jgi:glucose/arabinose dehydrogenase